MRKNHYYFEVPGSSLGRCNKVPTVPATISVSVSVQKNVKRYQKTIKTPGGSIMIKIEKKGFVTGKQ